MLSSCWASTPTKRPSAPEIVELLSNSPRLVCPCIDVPLASVQLERTDSLEMMSTSLGVVPTPQNRVLQRYDSGMGDVDDDVDMAHGYLILKPIENNAD